MELKKSISFSITEIAVISRVLIIFLQYISNILIKDHEAFDVFVGPTNLNETRSKDWIVEHIFGGFRRWDAQYFLHIAEHGYTYENSLAFFPLYPFLIKIVTKLIHPIITCLSFRGLALSVSIIMNVYFFTKAAKTIYRLSDRILGNKQSSKIAVLLFCINPASIFFTAPYSESLYAWMSFSVMEQCIETIKISSVVPLCLSILSRSNGLINIGFLIYSSFVNILKDKTIKNISSVIFKIISIVFCVFFHFGFLQFYHYELFCFQRKLKIPTFIQDFGIQHNYVMAGNKTNYTSPWCHATLPMAYSYVQNNYWNVGFLNYYQISQIPNFLLASPIICLTIYYSLRYFKRNLDFCLRLGLFCNTNILNKISKTDKNIFVFVVHLTFLAIFCLFFVHIQVSTRLLASSSPMIYWICLTFFKIKNINEQIDDVNFISLNFIKSILFLNSGRYIIVWFLSYSLIGTVMFSNFLPWT